MGAPVVVRDLVEFLYRRFPALRYFGEGEEAHAGVGPALVVVRGGGNERFGVLAGAVPVAGVEGVVVHAERVGLTAHLVEGREAVVAVEGRVLDPLGRHGAGVLLEAAHPGALVVLQVLAELAEDGVLDELEDGGLGGGVALEGAVEGFLHHLARLVLLVREEGAVAVERRDDFPKRLAQGGERDVAGVIVGLGETVEFVGQPRQLAGEGLLDDEGLAPVGAFLEGTGVGDGAAVDAVERLLAVGVEEHAHRVVQKPVAGGAFDRPVFGQGLAGGQDLLHPDAVGTQVAEAVEVLVWIEEAVDVVDAHAVHTLFRQQVAEQAVRTPEQVLVLHPQAHQVVDREEAAVVDFASGGLPVREAPVLLLQQAVQGLAVERLVEKLPVEGHVHGVEPAAEGLGALAGRRVEVGEGVTQLLEVEVGVGPLELGEQGLQHLRVGAGAQGEPVLVVGRREAPVVVGEGDLAVVERGAVGRAEEGEQNFAPQLRLQRIPVHVEVVGGGGVRAVGEHVLPRLIRRAHARVVGHEVEHEAEVRLDGGLAERLKPLAPPERLADAVVVDHVVAVRAAGPRLGDGGEVEVAHAELSKIRHERLDLGEAELRGELEAVGGGHGLRVWKAGGVEGWKK